MPAFFTAWRMPVIIWSPLVAKTSRSGVRGEHVGRGLERRRGDVAAFGRLDLLDVRMRIEDLVERVEADLLRALLKLPGMYAALHGFLFPHALTIHWPMSFPLMLSRCPMTELMPFTCGLIESRSGPMSLKIATTLMPALIASSVGFTSTAPLTGVITNASNFFDTIASWICPICRPS